MISYTKRYLNIVSLLITIPIFLFSSNSFDYISKINFNTYHISNILKRSTVQVELKTSNINQETEEKVELRNITSLSKAKEEVREKQWKIEIPKISLEAEICEGTSNEVMNKCVGHFEETSIKSGNIGLAAHNRGYPVNYFENIKKLKQGDKIIYKYYDFEKTYIVSKNIIITDIDWSYLEKTEENTITLITCVENEPIYRRCVQAIEEK